jgi:GDP-L-fucose synthase
MVGHNILDLAKARGLEVVAPSHAEVNLLKADAVASAIQRIAPSIVVHAAGRVGGIEANMREPVAFLSENWEMGRNVIMGARQAHIPRLINLGSSCMYPRDMPRALTERDLLTGPFEPTNEAYAIAKIAVQRLAAYVGAEDTRFSYKTLIPCNLYGRYDTFDPLRSHLAAAAIRKLHHAKEEGADTVDIWGDGTARREFLYAGDLAEAVVTAIQKFESCPPVVNIGAGMDYSVNDYYRTAAVVVGYQGSFRHDLSKPVGMKQKLMDVGLAASWGWRAQTSLADGLAQTYAYYVSAVSRL